MRLVSDVGLAGFTNMAGRPIRGRRNMARARQRDRCISPRRIGVYCDVAITLAASTVTIESWISFRPQCRVPAMPNVQDYDIAYSKKREQAERQASALANDRCAKAVHRSLALLYGDRVISARRAINASGLKS
ncbi:hypothetical protein [Sphingomonas sp. NFX23]|jgi:hypothetical protein|uniref:hypothetical protein n=1 Tax=Sphingomonas sp. NFX23 TaxID=2819532 RepID=UPI003CE93158